MGLHHQKLKSALSKYSPLVAEKKTEEDIRAAIAQDEKKFNPEEIDEIYQALTKVEDGSNKDEAPKKDESNEQEKPKESPKEEKTDAPASASKKVKHIVVSEFRDASDFSLVHEEGKDVSSFSPERLEHLVKIGVVAKSK